MFAIGVILSVLAAIFWGANAFFIKKVLEKTDFVIVAFLAVLTGAVMVTVIWLVTERAVIFSPHDLSLFLVAGIINFSVFNICYIYGIRQIGLSRAAPISSSYVIFTTVFAAAILRENVTVGIGIGVALLFIGLALLGRGKFTERLQVSKAIVYILLAALLLSLYPILIRLALEGATYSVLEGLVFSMWGGTLSNACFILVSHRWLRGFAPSKNIAIYSLFSAGLASVIANFCYYSALSMTPVIIVNPLSSFYPFVAIGLGFFFAKETITKRTLIGAALIFLGICSVLFI